VIWIRNRVSRPRSGAVLHSIFERHKNARGGLGSPATGDPQRSSNTLRRGRCLIHTVFHYTTRSCIVLISVVIISKFRSESTRRNIALKSKRMTCS